ncbi:MAG: adenylyl-sulfate kinase [Deltaproteobacteria bacterium RIFOXYA12_FULL_58_15]|nr:MAG: adenylyl-sulfate kinase [Deltaproteobacteria bacterium RIFOXYA12_FULL_58_15]OGR10443.1 MAG: adenylyl-sulfate kinase [Deltaproteobacteria bacterium RIFOXYB12_FULL_58_9]
MTDNHERRITRPHPNLVWHNAVVRTQQREKALGQSGCVVWLTGLSGVGKSTLAVNLDKALYDRGKHSFILDGDNVRHTLCADLGFSASDRAENIRRVSQVSRLFRDAGMICIVAFISPFREDRDRARKIIGDDRFVEAYLEAPLSVCEERDPKGLYAKVRAGEISEFTGISSPYEVPENPEIVLHTADESIGESVNRMLTFLDTKGLVKIS